MSYFHDCEIDGVSPNLRDYIEEEGYPDDEIEIEDDEVEEDDDEQTD